MQLWWYNFFLVESDGEENAEEKPNEQECDEEQQNCFDIIPEIKEIIKKLRKMSKFSANLL